MKHLSVWILLLFLLCGCGNSTAPAEAALWTEEQLLETFQQNAREGAVYFDGVIMEETACEIAGVVQYTLGDENVCRFDFIKADGSVCRMGMEFGIDGEKTLQCAGKDSISFRMIDQENGGASIMTILYYEDAATEEKGFRVSQEQVMQPEETFHRESSEGHDDPSWTENELLTAFYQYAEDSTEVIDCIVLESSQWDMAGVIQYTTPDYPGCWFDFIRNQGIPRSVGVESPPAGEDTLLCVGADAVSCKLRDKDGTEFVCTVSYYENPESQESGFKIITG